MHSKHYLAKHLFCEKFANLQKKGNGLILALQSMKTVPVGTLAGAKQVLTLAIMDHDPNKAVLMGRFRPRMDMSKVN